MVVIPAFRGSMGSASVKGVTLQIKRRGFVARSRVARPSAYLVISREGRGGGVMWEKGRVYGVGGVGREGEGGGQAQN